MNMTRLIVGTLALVAASAASAGVPPLGTPVGEVMGATLGGLMGGPLGRFIVESGTLLLIGAATLVVGIYIVRRKQRR